MRTRVLGDACRSLSSTGSRALLAAAIGLGAAALPIEEAEAKFPAGLVFADKRPVTVDWKDLAGGRHFRLCNTNDDAAPVSPVLGGFEFMRGGKPADDEAALSVTDLPESETLAGGRCIRLTLVTDGGMPVDEGTYSGILAVVGKGAGIARLRVTIERSMRGVVRGAAETHMALGRAEHGGLQLQQTVRLHVPARDPDLLDIARFRDGQKRENAVEALLERFGFRHVYYSPFVTDLELEVEKRQAVVTLFQPRDLYSFDSLTRLEGVATDGEARLSQVDDNMRLEVSGPDPEARVDWRSSVEIDPDMQRSWHPPPAFKRGALVRWSFPAGADEPLTSLTFELGAETRRKLTLGNKGWQTARAFSFFAAEALLAGLLLWVLLRPAGREGPSPRRRLVRVAVAAIALVLGMLAVWVLQTHLSLPTPRVAGEDQLGYFCGLFGMLLAPLVGAGCLLSVARKPDENMDSGAVGRVAIVIAVAGATMFAVAARTFEDAHPGPLEQHWARMVLAASAPLLAFLLTLIVIGAAVLIVRWSWPEDWLRARTDALSRRARRWGLVALAAVVAAQWTLAASVRYEDHPTEVRSGSTLVWWDAFTDGIRYFPLGMLGRVVGLLPLLLAIATLPLLRAYANGVSPTRFCKRDPPIRLLVYLFAGVVVGMGGILEGFRLPLGFVLAAVLLSWLLTDRRHRSGATLLSRDEFRRRLRMGLKREDRQRQLRKLYGNLSDGTDNLDEYRAKVDELPEPSRDPDPLSRGPYDDWWKNITAAAQLGAYASIAPIAYYIAVVVFHRIDDDLSSAADFGALDLLAGLTAEAATWLFAAIVFGGLYAHLPGRQGPVKGLFLSLVFAGAIGLSAEILPEETNTWAFRALEMLLFLGVLGYLLDRRTVEGHDYYWRELFDLYHLRETRFAAGYAGSLAVAVLAVFQQILSGEASETIKALVEAAGGAFPDPNG